MLREGLRKGADGLIRCSWSGDDPLYCRYHDDEWGRPVSDDRRLFEKLCLEGFQSGLSWLTILKKRPAFRSAFADFEFTKVARFGAKDVQRLLTDASIVRHRGKIEAAIQNAKCAVDLALQQGSLAAYFWSFVPPDEERPRKLTWSSLRAMSKTPSSVRMAKDLKKRGFAFVGPTTAYAFMQAMGIVNDHLDGCAQQGEVERARRAFLRASIR